MSTALFNENKMKAFEQKVIGDASAMGLGSLAYIGEKLGLFKQLVQCGPTTVEEFAKHTGCMERYIREWLSAMAAAEWIEYDAEKKTFTLPQEHAPFLALEDHPAYIGGMLQAVVPMAHVAPKIADCFKNGGGISFEDHHPDMPAVVDGLTAPHFKNFLTQVWIPKLLPDVHRKLTEGAEVADVGCGAGRALIQMARAYPKSRFTGIEPNEKSAEMARQAVREHGLEDRITVEVIMAEEMKDKEYDFITTFDVIHDLVQPQEVVDAIYRSLKPDGVFLMLEIHASHRLEDMIHPLGRFLYSISTTYCMTVSLAHGGAGIGTCMGEVLPRQMTEKAGFTKFEKLDFEHPLVMLYEIRK